MKHEQLTWPPFFIVPEEPSRSVKARFVIDWNPIIPRSLVTAIILTAVLFTVATQAAAQQSGEEQGVPVRMVVSVEPKHGHELPLITKQDVMVYQGHDRRPVADWVPAKGDKSGLALAILIDDGAAISLGDQLNDIRAFIQEQPPTTQVAVGYMQYGTVQLAHDFTQDHAAAAKSVRLTQGFVAEGGSPYLSLSSFIKKWNFDPALPRREVLMITSGIDNVYSGTIDNPYVEAAIEDARCAGVMVYSVYTPDAGHLGHSFFRTNWGQNYLSELSEMTGGENYYIMGPQAPVSFSPYLKELNNQLPNQFLLTFLAKPEKKAGIESVKVTSEIHDVDFVHADKVCVPASPGQ